MTGILPVSSTTSTRYSAAFLIGTRAFELAPGVKTFEFTAHLPAKDEYFTRERFSRIDTSSWNGRFYDFELERVDLLSGNDSAIIMHENNDLNYYRTVGDELIGSGKRLTNIENINRFYLEIRGD